MRTKTLLSSAGAVGILTVALTGCAGSDDLDFSRACAQIDEGKDIPVCSELLDGDPALDLPEGTASAPLGAFTAAGDAFHTVSGENLSISPDVLGQFENHEPYSTYVFQATISDDTVTAVTPVLEVTDDAVMNRVFGGRTLVGTMSTLAAPGSYDLESDVPVIVQLDASAKDGFLPGTILNLDTGIVAPDGTCIAALPSDETNPLQGDFTEKVSIQRFPSMHGPFDDEMVFLWTKDSSGMGHEFYPSIATLFSGGSIDGTWNIMQHGTPDSGPALQLTLEDALATPTPC